MVEQAILSSLPLHLQYLDSILYREFKHDGKNRVVDDPRLRHPEVLKAIEETFGRFDSSSDYGWGKLIFEPGRASDEETLRAIHSKIWPVYAALYDKAVEKEIQKQAFQRMIQEDPQKTH